MDEVTLKEPLTEFTADLCVDIFDGNLFVEPISWDGVAAFRVGIAGPQPEGA